jgi:sec-independent protein translocase protein TatA
VLLIGGIGVPELVIILVIVIVLFGASRLPQIGRGLGEGISNFKRSMKSGREQVDEEEKASKS